MNLYLGLDIRSVRNALSSTDMMDVKEYAIATSLPNPKLDAENDDLEDLDDRNEESEVVALGTVSATTYWMSTIWDDYRTGGPYQNGEWRVQFHMSGQYLPMGIIKTDYHSAGQYWIPSYGDYNLIWMPYVNQAIIPYGRYAGAP